MRAKNIQKQTLTHHCIPSGSGIESRFFFKTIKPTKAMMATFMVQRIDPRPMFPRPKIAIEFVQMRSPAKYVSVT